MTSNRTEGDNYWSGSEVKGFNFSDELDNLDDESNPWMKDLPSASKVKDELREEIVSVYSGISEASSCEDIQLNTKLYPDFLVLDSAETDSGFTDGGLPKLLKLRDSYSEKSEEHRGIGTAVKGVICSLLLGQEVNLDRFRSLVEKKSLLTKAMEFQDGNAILAITLFLQRTLRASLFQQIMMENKGAADHYIRYLQKRSETSNLIDFLTMLGRTRDALIIRYKVILRSERDLVRSCDQLKHFHKADCSLSDDYLADLVRSHYTLIECHKGLKAKDPGLDPMRLSSVLKTLGYLAEHYSEDTAPPFSPVCFRATHNLNERQFAWVNLVALIKAQNWPKIDSLLLTKSWLGLGGSKEKCILPLEGVCLTLALKEAPIDQISKFLRLIDDEKKRLQIAKKFKCHMVVLEAYEQQRDRVAILSYRPLLVPNSKEYIYMESLLTKRNIKWKN